MPPETEMARDITMAESEAEFGPIRTLWYRGTEVGCAPGGEWYWTRPECARYGYAEMRDALWGVVKYLTDQEAQGYIAFDTNGK